MSGYNLTNVEYRRLLKALHKALSSQNPTLILKEANHGLSIFATKGYPDQWSDWQRAKDDALFQLKR